MKSSLLTLIVVSTMVLSGCFRNSDNCSSCADDSADTVHCAACPTTDMIAPEATVIIDDENAPMEDEFIAVVEDEK